PFEGETVYAMARAHASKAVPPLGEGLPVELDPVLAKAMAKRPADRFTSAIEFANAVRAASGLADERPPLPQLDQGLREAWMSEAPQPLAEAVAALGAARNAHQAREEMWQIVHVAVRVLGLYALACRTRIGAGRAHDAKSVVSALRALRHKGLSDEEWV